MSWNNVKAHQRIPNYIRFTQDSALSPYLFVLFMDVLTRHVQDEAPWYVEATRGAGRKIIERVQPVQPA